MGYFQTLFQTKSCSNLNGQLFATLIAITKAVSRIFFTRLSFKVELLMLCQSDLIVESFTIGQFVASDLPKFTWQTKMILIDQEKVLVMKPDVEVKACIYIENYSVVRTWSDSS